MAHYAILSETNMVVNVFVGRDEDDLPEGITSWEDYYGAINDAVVKRTSYNTIANVHYTQEIDEDGNRVPSADQSKAFRYNYAQIGGHYHPEDDAFSTLQPVSDLPIKYELDTTNYTWVETTVPVENP